MKKGLLICLSFFLVMVMVASASAKGGKPHFTRGFKNVIVMVPDGCDETVQTLARWMKGSDLQVDNARRRCENPYG